MGTHGPIWHFCNFSRVFQCFWRFLVGNPSLIRVFTVFCSTSSKIAEFLAFTVVLWPSSPPPPTPVERVMLLAKIEFLPCFTGILAKLQYSCPAFSVRNVDFAVQFSPRFPVENVTFLEFSLKWTKKGWRDRISSKTAAATEPKKGWLYRISSKTAVFLAVSMRSVDFMARFSPISNRKCHNSRIEPEDGRNFSFFCCV